MANDQTIARLQRAIIALRIAQYGDEHRRADALGRAQRHILGAMRDLGADNMDARTCALCGNDLPDRACDPCVGVEALGWPV